MGMIVQGKELWRALFTRTRRRVVGLFFGHPQRSFYANQVVRLVDVGTGSVQRELVRLTQAGLLMQKRIGNQVHYQANPDCPIFDELRSMVLKTFGALAHIREAIRPHQSVIDWALLYGPGVESGDPHDELALLVVSATLDREALESVVSPAVHDTGRSLNITLLRPQRYEALMNNQDERILRVLKAPGVSLIGSEDLGRNVTVT